MARPLSSATYRLAIIFAVLVFVSTGIVILYVTTTILPHLYGGSDLVPFEMNPLAGIISVLTLLVSAIGTASTIVLGWRAERRQAAESQLKVRQLELDLAELTQKLEKSN
jgi:hypothetical protein